jgi:hypothetical protein
MANPEDYMAEGRPYRPSNGTEGHDFQSRWCGHCANDDVDEDMLCPILGNALFGDQPAEWVYRNRQPTCTAFVRFGDDGPLPLPRCARTPDFFAEHA